MGTTLTGTTPQDTYDSLIKVTDNGPLSGSLKKLTDGLGNDSSLSLSTGAASIAGTLAVTGNAAFDTNTLFVDAANDRVGMGTSSPSTKLSIVDNSPLVVGSSSGSISVTEETGTTLVGQGGGIFLGIPAASGSFFSTFIKASRETTDGASGAAALIFGTRIGGGANTERMRITSDGYLRMASGSLGIQFNGDTAAANALDDYEEGTFTATLTPETSGSITGSPTYTTWTYTKIGRQVTINGVFVVSSVSSPVGNFIKLGGLPFAVLAVNGAYGSFSTMFTDASAGSAKSSLPSWHSIAVSEIWMSIDASTIAANDEFYVTATYFV
jgi:hypothetical protein